MRVALVTGGSRGIGAAIVRRLIREKMAVAFTYSSAPEKAVALAAEIESEGGRALTINADSANATELRDAITKTVEAFGRLNILVNNAGTRVPDVGRCNPSEWRAMEKAGLQQTPAGLTSPRLENAFRPPASLCSDRFWNFGDGYDFK